MPFRLHELAHGVRFLIEEELSTGWQGVALLELANDGRFAVYTMERLDEPVLTELASPDEALDAYVELVEDAVEDAAEAAS